MAGLYIHIPKCASKCAYCDFYSVAGVDNARLVAALKAEITARRDFFRAPTAPPASGFSGLDTIYFGGGTPSQLTPEQLQDLLRHAFFTFHSSLFTLKELTLEANPEDLTDDYLSKLAATDFNRLSIGVQSFDDGLLRLMNRRHTAVRARQAVRQAQKNGFDNISIDLIWGIPGMTAEQLSRTLESALELGVQHISAYHLTIEPGTAFGRWAAEGKLVSPPGSPAGAPADGSFTGSSAGSPADGSFTGLSEGMLAGSLAAGLPAGSPRPFAPIAEAESERQYEILRRMLSEGGFEQYEISNWALPGRRAVHNSAYWSGAPYLGVGPGAHSFDGARTRGWVAPDVEKYLAHFAAGTGCGRDFAGGAGGESILATGAGNGSASGSGGAGGCLARDFEGVVGGFKSEVGGVECAVGDFAGAIGGENGDLGGIYGGEVLTDVDLRNERLMVGLRRVEGVKASDVEGVKVGGVAGVDAGDDEASDAFRRRVEKFLHDGLLVERPACNDPHPDRSERLDSNDPHPDPERPERIDRPECSERLDRLDESGRGASGRRIAIPPERFLLSDYIISSLFV